MPIMRGETECDVFPTCHPIELKNRSPIGEGTDVSSAGWNERRGIYLERQEYKENGGPQLDRMHDGNF